MKKYFFYLLFLLPIYCSSKKTNCKALWNKFDKQITLSNSSIGMPNHLINGRLQLGIETGIERGFKNGKSKTSYQILAGYFAQQSLQRVIYLKPNIGHNFRLFNTVKIRPSISLSVMGVRQSNNEFEFKNGEYINVPNKRIQLMPAFGIELGFPIFKSPHFQYHSILKYEFGTQLPFSLLSSILPINQIHLGFKRQKK